MPETYHAGQLDDWVTLRAPAARSTQYGSGPIPYTDVARVPALVEPLQGRDLVYASQTQSLATHKVVIRWRGDIASTWRIFWEGREMEIDGIPLEVGRQQWIRLNAIASTRKGQA